jgi:cyanophycin synthetase
MQVYPGSNIYSHKPVIRMEIELGKLVDVPTNNIVGFNEQLIQLFPGLKEHKCSLGYAGGFIKRLNNGTYIAHVIEHLCLEMQNLAGHDIKFGKTRNIQEDIYQVVYECFNPVIGKACGFAAVNIINAIIERRNCDIEQEMSKFKEICVRYNLGPSTSAIVNEAKERGIPVKEIANSGMMRLGYGKYQKYISATLYEGTNSLAVDIACDKSLTKALLEEVFIPVPRGDVCYFKEEAIRLADNIGYPVVVKPKFGNKGKFVFLDIQNEEDLTSAFQQVKTYDEEVIVEEYINGKDYRLLVVGGRLVAASERIPAYITGDGIHSVMELVEIKNLDEFRGEGHEKPLTKIKIDECVIKTLTKQKLKLDSVVEKDRIVWLRENANLSTGGIAIDCTEKVHPENQRIAEIAAKTIGLDIAGIDMITPDISRTITSTHGAIVEVNAAPGIRMHLYPASGKKRNVASPIIDMIYPPGTPFTIPIVSITGTNGKTTTTRMVSNILQRYGYTVGMTTTHGIYINNKCIEKGDTTGFNSALRVLNNREVDAAVLETARGGIIRGGLAYDKADVAIFTNLSGDHLGFDGIDTIDDLLYIKSLVVEAVKENGASILNADDEYVMKIRQYAKGKIILFSMDSENQYIREHISAGGCAVYVKGGNIYLTNSGVEKVLIQVNGIPATLKGILKHNIYNGMAAISATYALKIPLGIIKKSLANFETDAVCNPGRFNIYDLGDFKVILDYGHNLEGYRVTIDGLKKMNPSGLIGVIGSPGNRRDEDIKEIGKLSGQFFDTIIIKEDSNLRGRLPLEVANILRLGALESNIRQENIKIIREEEAALKYALNKAKKGEIIVVFFENMEPLIKIINQYHINRDSKLTKSRILEKEKQIVTV